ncbi:MAG: ABC transporter permease [Bacteroidota bacterium]
MKVSENVTMAFTNILNNKIRSFLTMLGIIIGVGAVIAMVSIGEGAKKRVTDSISAMGSNLLIVTRGRGGRGGGFGKSSTRLGVEEVELIRKSSSYIKTIAPEVRSNQTVSCGGDSLETTVFGCTVAYPEVRNYQLASGRFFTEEEIKSSRRVAVLGSYVADELFPGSNPVGAEISAGRLRFEVIGVLAEKGQSGFNNSDDLVLAPLTTVQRKLVGTKDYQAIYIQVKDETLMDQTYDQIYEALLEHYRDEDKFNLRNQAEILATVQESSKTFTFLLAGIAAVSLLVGGIGIMNIMLVSVTERIREIGIRKAIGARKEEILSLFLIEAVILSLSGGIMGIAVGCLAAKLMANFFGWAVAITLPSILLSFAFSIGIGLFFGVYPAYKASGLNPIEALRHE